MASSQDAGPPPAGWDVDVPSGHDRVFGIPVRMPAEFGAVPLAVREALVFALKEQLEMLMSLMATAAMQAGPAGAPRYQAEVRRSPDPCLRDHRVLIVDDDPVQAAMLTRRLARSGFDAATVEVATSGFEALVAASDRAFRLVFVDWHMPGLNGVETVSRLRTIMSSTPIVGCTSDYSREMRAAFLAAGADDCLAKPIGQPVLDAVVLRWLTGEPPS